MIAFLLSPVMTFFSSRLYRSALRAGIGRGLAYLFYLTVLFCFLVVFLCQFLLIPVTSNFTEWLIQITPELTVTQTGLSVSAAQPYLVKHPALGPLYLIDTAKSLDELVADQSGTYLLIGKEHVVARSPRRGQTRIFDLKQAMERVRLSGQPIQITKNLMRELDQRLQVLMIPVVLLLLAPLFFVWKLLIAFFYSLIALGLNLFRKEKIRYSSLFTMTCYAITPVILIQAVHISIPDMYFNLNFGFAFALSVAYLIYGMFVTIRHTH